MGVRVSEISAFLRIKIDKFINIADGLTEGPIDGQHHKDEFQSLNRIGIMEIKVMLPLSYFTKPFHAYFMRLG